MAKRIKLPTVKIRQRSTTGKSKLKRISRGTMNLKRMTTSNCNENMKIHEASSESEDDGDCNWEQPIIDNLKFMSDQPSEHISCSTDELPSLYSVKKKLAADAWEAVRERLRNACIESYALAPLLPVVYSVFGN